MRNIYLLLLFTGLFFTTSLAQLPSGSTAEDWTLTDIDGNTHNLYTYLDQGYTVYLDFSATWCAPCWNYHNSGAYENLYENHGPNGSDQVRVFFIEADLSTGIADLYGNTSSTQGDWVQGTPYPIINLNSPQVSNDYNISYYPTLYAVCPDKKLYEMQQVSESSLDDWIASCSMQAQLNSSQDVQCYGDNNGSIDISLTGGHGNQDYEWSNGATTQDLTDLSPGTYSCTVYDGPTAADGGHREAYVNDVSIDGPPAPVTTEVEQVNDILCHGDQSGMIDISVTGGTPDYNYNWSNGATSQDLSNLSGGTYSVTVTDDNGCQKELSATVEEPQELTLEVIVEDATCGQQNGSLTLLSGGGTGTHMYDIGNGYSPNEYYPDLQAGSYTVFVNDGNNCQESQSVTIEQIPAPTADAGSSSQLDCSGEPVELDGSGSDQGSNLTYEWVTTDGNIVEGSQTLTPKVDQAGTYELQVTDNNTNCVSTDVVAVVAPPSGPNADAGPDQTLNCGVSEIELNGSGSESGDNISYNWDTEDGNIVEGEHTLHPIIDEAGSYVLTVIDENSGCTSTAETVVNLDDQFPEASISEPGSLTCAMDEVTLDASESEQDSNINFEWTDSEGKLIAQTLEVTVTEAGTYTFHISDESNGCGQSVDVEVTVDRDQPSIEAGASTQLTCTAQSVHLHGEVMLDSNYTVEWTTEDGHIVSGADSLAPEVDRAGWYFMTVLNSENGCSNTDSVEVSLDDDVPEATVATPPMITCIDTTITLNASGSSNGDQYKYNWSTEDGQIVSGSNTLNPEVNAQGEYVLEVTNEENGCTATTSVTVEEHLEEPTAVYGTEGNGFTITFNDQSQGNPNDWEWSFGDGNTSDQENPTHSFSRPGTYTVCLTVTNDCGEHTICREIEIGFPFISDYKSDIEPCHCPMNQGEGRQQSSVGSSVQIYPNPVSSDVTVTGQWQETQDIEIELIDATGKTLRTIDRRTNIVNLTWNMDAMPSGMYLIKFRIQGETIYHPIIKQ